MLLFLLLSILSFSQQPKLIFPTGHTGALNSASFSSDGSKVVTTSNDKTAIIWDSKTGKLLANLVGHSDSVSNACFSPDDTKIVTVSIDGTAKIWDTRTGEIIYVLDGDENMLYSAKFSPDGTKIFTTGYDFCKLWDVASGKLIKNFEGENGIIDSFFSRVLTYKTDHYLEDNSPYVNIWDANTGVLINNFIGHSGDFYFANFSPDGSKIVITYDDNTCKILDSTSGNLIANLTGHTDCVRSAYFSDDGNKIVTFSDDYTSKIWDSKTGLLIQDIKIGKIENPLNFSINYSFDGNNFITAYGNLSNTLKIWDIKTGELFVNLKGLDEDELTSITFSLDRKKIIIAYRNSSSKIFDVKTGKIITDLEGYLTGNENFSPDGTKIVTYSNIDNSAKIWDLNSGKLIFNLKERLQEFRKSYFSPDGTKIISDFKGIIKIRDLLTGKLLLNINIKDIGDFEEISPDGKKISTIKYNDVSILNAKNGNILFHLKGHTGQVSAHFYNNGLKIVTLCSDQTAKIWDALNGNLIADLKGHIKSVNFSPDETKIVTASYDKTAKIWDALNGNLIADLKGHIKSVNYARFSPDGNKIVTASTDKTIKIWDVKTGKLIENIELYNSDDYQDDFEDAYFTRNGKQIIIYIGNRVKIWDCITKKIIDVNDEEEKKYSGLYSPDGTKFVTYSNHGTTKIWDTKTEKLITDLVGSYAFFSPDGTKIVTILDEITKIWDATTGKLLYNWIAIDDSDYLVFDNDGRYDGTDAARNLLYLTCGTEIIDLEQVKDQLWVPNLAQRIIEGDIINAKTLVELDICGLTPEVEEGHGSIDDYYFKITPRRGGLGDTVLYINDIEFKRFQVTDLKNKGDYYELILKKNKLIPYFVDGKENSLTVKSYTADNTISSRGANPIPHKTNTLVPVPNLYAVMIGVSDYKTTKLKLKYAAKDATDISMVVKNAAKKLLNIDKQEHVFIYNLTTAEEHDLLPEKKAIKKVLNKISDKATPNDILLIFFAGHGVIEGEKKQFYFLTADASDFTDVADVGISTSELTEWIKPQNIKAQKRILIFDACNSGQIINDFVKYGTENQNYLASRNDNDSQQTREINKLNEKSGLYILSASASNQSAYEMGRYSQGLLTYSLLKAIKQDPQILEDGKYLNVGRWFNAAEKTVSELSIDNRARQNPQIVTNSNFNIGSVDDEVIGKIILPSEKPLFSSSNFQNSDENVADDNLDLTKLVNHQLNDLATSDSEAAIVYITNTYSPDAYSLTGRYTLTGNEISITVNIKQNKVIISKFEIKGITNKLDELVKSILEKAYGIVK